jgi:hypothetical protein
VVEIAGRLNVLLGENAYPNKVRGVWKGGSGSPLHRETHYFGGPVFLSASSLAGLARFNNPPKAAFCARSSYALNVSEQVPSRARTPDSCD